LEAFIVVTRIIVYFLSILLCIINEL
jgi:hypothetical protein